MIIDESPEEHLLAHIAADLEGMPFPASKGQVIDYVMTYGQCENKEGDIQTLSRLEDQIYESPTQLMAEVGALKPD